MTSPSSSFGFGSSSGFGVQNQTPPVWGGGGGGHMQQNPAGFNNSNHGNAFGFGSSRGRGRGNNSNRGRGRGRGRGGRGEYSNTGFNKPREKGNSAGFGTNVANVKQGSPWGATNRDAGKPTGYFQNSPPQGFGFGTQRQSPSPPRNAPLSDFGFGGNSGTHSPPGQQQSGFYNTGNISRQTETFPASPSPNFKRNAFGQSQSGREKYSPSNSFNFSSAGNQNAMLEAQNPADTFTGGTSSTFKAQFKSPANKGAYSAKIKQRPSSLQSGTVMHSFGFGSSAKGNDANTQNLKSSPMSSDVKQKHQASKRSFKWERAASKPKVAQEKPTTTKNWEKSKGQGLEEDELERIKREAISSMPVFAGGKAQPPSSQGDARAERMATKSKRALRKGLKKDNQLSSSEGLHASSTFTSTPLKSTLKNERAHQQNLDETAVVGTCETMCPAAELEKRFRTTDFDELEIADPQLLAVKKFARTITEEDRLPDRLRTRNAILKTMQYLSSLMDSKSTTFEKVHRFLWDRYRAIRQDISIQDIKDEFAVQIYERMVRFHIIAEHELCEETATVGNPHGFNSHLNIEQMYKCLTSLFDRYNELASEDNPQPNEPEFRAYYLLLTLDTHGKYRRDKSAHSFALGNMRSDVLQSKEVQFAIQVSSLYHEGNFYKFFDVVRNATFVTSCILHAYFQPLRSRALKMFAYGAYGRSKALPVQFIQKLLLLDSEQDTIDICQDHGLGWEMINNENVILVGQRSFRKPEEPSRRKMSQCISMKCPSTYSECCVEDAASTNVFQSNERNITPSKNVQTFFDRAQPSKRASVESSKPEQSVRVAPAEQKTLNIPPLKDKAEVHLQPILSPVKPSFPSENQNFPQNQFMFKAQDQHKENISQERSALNKVSALPLFQENLFAAKPKQDKRRREQSFSPPTAITPQNKKRSQNIPTFQEQNVFVPNAAEKRRLLEEEERLREEAQRIQRQKEFEEEVLRREYEARIVLEQKRQKQRELEMRLKQAFVDFLYVRTIVVRYGRLWKENTAKILQQKEREKKLLLSLKRCNLSASLSPTAFYAFPKHIKPAKKRSSIPDFDIMQIDMIDVMSTCFESTWESKHMFWKVLLFGHPLLDGTSCSSELYIRMQMGMQKLKNALADAPLIDRSLCPWEDSIIQLNTYRQSKGLETCEIHTCLLDIEPKEVLQGRLNSVNRIDTKLLGVNGIIFTVAAENIPRQCEMIEKLLAAIPNSNLVPVFIMVWLAEDTSNDLNLSDQFSTLASKHVLKVELIHNKSLALCDSFKWLASSRLKIPVLQRCNSKDVLLERLRDAFRIVRNNSFHITSVRGIVNLLNSIIEHHMSCLERSLLVIKQYGWPASEWGLLRQSNAGLNAYPDLADFEAQLSSAKSALDHLLLPWTLKDLDSLWVYLEDIEDAPLLTIAKSLQSALDITFEWASNRIQGLSVLHQDSFLLQEAHLSVADTISLSAMSNTQEDSLSMLNHNGSEKEIPCTSHEEYGEEEDMQKSDSVAVGSLPRDDVSLLLEESKDSSHKFQDWLIAEVAKGKIY